MKSDYGLAQHDIVSFDSDQILVRYSGGDADFNSVEAGQFSRSLAGWSLLFETVAQAVILRTSDGQPAPGIHFSLRVKSVRPGSLEAVLEVLFWGAAASAVWDGVKVSAPRLWSATKACIRILRETKEQDQSVQFMAQRLEALRDYCLPVTPPTPESREVQSSLLKGEPVSVAVPDGEPEDRYRQLALDIDTAAQEIAVPVAASVESMEARTVLGETIAFITPADKRLLTRPFKAELSKPDELLQTRRVRLLGLNKLNGWGRFRFVDAPHSPEEVNQQECKVLDPALRRRRDPYTKALHEGSDIAVYIDRRNRSSGTVFWEITGVNDGIQPFLFERNGG